MGKSKRSAISLVVLGILAVLVVVGRSLIMWEWWDFLLILSSMAFVVGLALFVARKVLR